jgi:hypothetical protein
VRLELSCFLDSPSALATQKIEAVEPLHSESSIRVPHKPLDKSQPGNTESDSLKQELKISYRVTVPRYTESPTQHKVVPPRYMTGAQIFGNLHFVPYGYYKGTQNKFAVTFDVTQAKMDPRFDHCEASIDNSFGSLSRSPTQDDQRPLRYVWDVLYELTVPLTLSIVLHFSSKASEGLMRHFYAFDSSTQEDPAMKASLLNQVNTTGDLQLVCEVRKPL